MINTIENLHGILDNLYDGVYIVDKSRKIIYWNKAAEDISGYKYSDVVGSHCFNDILQQIDSDGNPLCRQGCPLIHTIEEGQIKETEVFLHHKTGYRVPILVKALPLKNENGETIGAIEIFSENSKHKNILKKMKDLENLAMLDELTQIPNRRYIENLINLKYNEFLLNGINFGIIFFDIDHFKKINDNYGHDIGDLILKTVSKTFSKNIRGNDIIGRWGGDEFIGVFSGINKKELKIIADKFNILVEKTYIELENKKINVTISIGATLANPNENMNTIIKRADKFLYMSKNRGRNCATTE